MGSNRAFLLRDGAPWSPGLFAVTLGNIRGRFRRWSVGVLLVPTPRDRFRLLSCRAVSWPYRSQLKLTFIVRRVDILPGMESCSREEGVCAHYGCRTPGLGVHFFEGLSAFSFCKHLDDVSVLTI